eukprot:01043.XXX_2749_2381_1 [CDS] Oithona nana genome sequencing.
MRFLIIIVTFFLFVSHQTNACPETKRPPRTPKPNPCDCENTIPMPACCYKPGGYRSRDGSTYNVHVPRSRDQDPLNQSLLRKYQRF